MKNNIATVTDEGRETKSGTLFHAYKLSLDVLAIQELIADGKANKVLTNIKHAIDYFFERKFQ